MNRPISHLLFVTKNQADRVGHARDGSASQLSPENGQLYIGYQFAPVFESLFTPIGTDDLIHPRRGNSETSTTWLRVPLANDREIG